MDLERFFSYPTAEIAEPAAEAGFLDQAGERDWNMLLAAMQTLILRPGDLAFEQGQADRGLYLLTDGMLEVAAPGAAAATFGAPPAAVLNEVAFLDGGRCLTTARAVTDARVLRLSYDAFEALAAREPQLARMIVSDLARMVARRVRHGAQIW